MRERFGIGNELCLGGCLEMLVFTSRAADAGVEQGQINFQPQQPFQGNLQLLGAQVFVTRLLPVLPEGSRAAPAVLGSAEVTQ